MAQVTPYDLCSRAFVLVGARPIEDFEGGSAESIAAGQVYEQLVEECLSDHRWEFASEMAVLSPMATLPKGKWAKFYELPGSNLLVRGCYAQDGETPIKYGRVQNRIACDETTQIVVDFTWRVAESLWPPYFRKFVTKKLAQSFAMGIARNESMAEAFGKEAMGDFKDAKRLDSQQQTTKRLRRGGLVSVRG